MIDSQPRWIHASKAKLTGAYDFVRVHDTAVLGRWWCRDLATGELRWETLGLAPDTIVGIGDGVIVATETRSRGPTTTAVGTWAISVDTGEVLWSRSGGVGLLRLLWMALRGRTDDLATSILVVKGGECVCENGSILDIQTGRELRRIDAQLAATVVSEDALLTRGRTQLSGAGFLRIGGTDEWGADGLVVQRFAPGEVFRWRFDSSEHAGSFSNGLSHFRYQGDHGYLIVSDESYAAAAPGPRDWSLWVLDLRSGEIVQRVELSLGSAEEHRIEDIDSRYLLWSRGRNQLFAHQRGGE